MAALTLYFGTDAGGIQIVSDGKGGWIVKRIPGWNPEQFSELSKAVSALKSAATMKTPGLFEKVAASVMPAVEKEVGQHIAAGGILAI